MSSHLSSEVIDNLMWEGGAIRAISERHSLSICEDVRNIALAHSNIGVRPCIGSFSRVELRPRLVLMWDFER